MMESLLGPQKIQPLDLVTVETTGWLASRGPEFRAALLQKAMLRQFDSGENLYLHGDSADGLYAVLSGAVKVTIPADDGQDFAAHRGGAGFWIGDLAMLSDQTRLVTVEATSPTRTLFVPAAWIIEMVRQTPSFHRDFYALSHQNMQLALRILANLAVANTNQRLILRLLHLDETLKQPDSWIAMSQDELAGMAALSVPTLQRALRKLANDGLLELGYGRLRVVDRKALLVLCQT